MTTVIPTPSPDDLKPTEPRAASWRRGPEPGLPLNIAHRGASFAAPQNTLAAFRLAEELGADGIEFDVHLSSDGVPVVIHDFSVDRSTDGTGLVSSMTLAELKRLDAGVRTGQEFAGERIPTLDEVLDSVGDDLLLNIELKSARVRDTGLARAVVARVLRRTIETRCLLSSFNPATLRRAGRLAPGTLAGLLLASGLPLPLRQAWAAPLVPHQARHPEHTMVDARYMAWARGRGLLVNAWTVDEPAEMHRLIELGVDGIITNRPGLLRPLLARARQADSGQRQA